MPAEIDASTLKSWLSDSREIALFDVREHGQYGTGHPFFSVPLPYSRFEIELPRLAPNAAVRVALCDGGDGVAGRAAARAAALGYRNIFVLAGGAKAWGEAGYTLYAGVNVPSKVFGELVEHRRHTPRVSAQDIVSMRAAKEDFVIVDGRPFAEYRKMNIPGGICCPNGELVLRIRDIAPDPNTKIVVNCAGRTRSIIGAQTLIDFGVPNPVFALENGTQGWFLAGLELEHGAGRRYADTVGNADLTMLRSHASKFAAACGAPSVAPATAHAWLSDSSRTTYLFDVRTAEEFAASGLPGFVHAPGGQLVQATDQWVGVKGARIVLFDREQVRAPVVAGWLRQLGHEACVLDDAAAAVALDWRRPAGVFEPTALQPISVHETAAGLRTGALEVIDLRASMAYRKGHMAGARWTTRPRLAAGLVRTGTVAIMADETALAALAAIDLAEVGSNDVRAISGGYQAWCDAGLPIEVSADRPADSDCIDFLFFTHGRHDGDAAAARQYLAWETGLLGQLDVQERGIFRMLANFGGIGRGAGDVDPNVAADRVPTRI
jgi:rhodanese-related sulfurtransferase